MLHDLVFLFFEFLCLSIFSFFIFVCSVYALVRRVIPPSDVRQSVDPKPDTRPWTPNPMPERGYQSVEPSIETNKQLIMHSDSLIHLVYTPWHHSNRFGSSKMRIIQGVVS